MNPIQIVTERVLAPKNIRFIEYIIENKEFGSGTPEEWNRELEAFKVRYQELLAFELEGRKGGEKYD
jgi:hypothetical protein